MEINSVHEIFIPWFVFMHEAFCTGYVLPVLSWHQTWHLWSDISLAPYSPEPCNSSSCDPRHSGVQNNRTPVGADAPGRKLHPGAGRRKQRTHSCCVWVRWSGVRPRSANPSSLNPRHSCWQGPESRRTKEMFEFGQIFWILYSVLFFAVGRQLLLMRSFITTHWFWMTSYHVSVLYRIRCPNNGLMNADSRGCAKYA